MFSAIIYILIMLVLIWWVETPQKLIANSLNIKNPAEDLEDWLKKFNWGNRSVIESRVRLPVYKFYGEVLELLLEIARKRGGAYQDSILFLREGLKSDRQFERKMKETNFGTWLQMLLMVGLTWAFIVAAQSMVDIRPRPILLVMILLWQATGLLLLPFLLARYRKIYFSEIGKIWKMLYILRALVRVPLSRSEIMGIAGIEELKNIRQKNLSSIKEKLMDTCQRALQQGGSYEEDVRLLMEELRFQENWHFELFEKRLMVVKLVLLTIFFLPSYLAFIFLLLGDLLALM